MKMLRRLAWLGLALVFLCLLAWVGGRGGVVRAQETATPTPAAPPTFSPTGTPRPTFDWSPGEWLPICTLTPTPGPSSTPVFATRVLVPAVLPTLPAITATVTPITPTVGPSPTPTPGPSPTPTPRPSAPTVYSCRLGDPWCPGGGACGWFQVLSPNSLRLVHEGSPTCLTCVVCDVPDMFPSMFARSCTVTQTRSWLQPIIYYRTGGTECTGGVCHLATGGRFDPGCGNIPVVPYTVTELIYTVGNAGSLDYEDVVFELYITSTVAVSWPTVTPFSTPTVTPTVTPTPWPCVTPVPGGIYTGTVRPIVEFNPPTVEFAGCYKVLPEMSLVPYGINLAIPGIEVCVYQLTFDATILDFSVWHLASLLVAIACARMIYDLFRSEG